MEHVLEAYKRPWDARPAVVGEDRCMAWRTLMASEAQAWAADRHARQVGLDRRFATTDARTKPKHLYLTVRE